MGIESKYESYLKAKLSFKKDVAPRNYSGVRDRLEISEKFYSSLLGDYLMSAESIEHSKSHVKDISSGKYRKVSIKSNKRKMTLDVCVTSQKTLEPDELLNVVNLYNFIATGKYPQKNNL